MSDLIVQKAIELASDNLIMNSYKDLFNGKGYFLTKNSSLDNSKRKPPKFPDSSKGFAKKWKDPQWFVYSQRTYLLILAKIDKNSTIKDSDYNKIRDAYNKWNSNYYVVLYGAESKSASNLFVGEALHLAGKKSLSSTLKYYSTKQIWNSEGIFKQINKKNVKKGDIAAFNGSHVEIITHITEKGWILKDKISFCSRGTGRNSFDFGIELCNDRKIDDTNIKFLRVS